MNNFFEYAEPKLIAEIGCNHMGDMAIARDLIQTAAVYCKVRTVKFQVRDNQYWAKMKPDMYNSPHPNPYNAYGATYLQHRENLEFTIEQHIDLKRYCNEYGVEYSTSVWDTPSAVKIAQTLNPSILKIPSACNNNVEMLSWLAENYGGEIHISTGMTAKNNIDDIVELFSSYGRNKDVVLYHCISGYPVQFRDTYLLEIVRLKEKYGSLVKSIGFSGHHLGIAIDIAAYTLGASVIERHYTLDRTWKGTDHAASLEPDGLRKLQRNLNAAFDSLKFKEADILDFEQVQFDKLKHVNK